ncbi:MAG: exodeoxyribonuclease III [Acidimicrobiales bacterium]
MRLATWNVNSLKARLERVESWLAETEPDVLCIQETKLADDAFPALTLASAGYDGVHHGQGRWNGVAILSRIGIADVVHGFAVGPPDPEARLLTARCGSTVVVTAYAPNGRAVGHEQFHYKLAWFDRLREHIDAVASPTEAVAVCGDLNIAPEDRDVWDIAAVHGATHVTDQERARFASLLDWGMVDVFRRAHPDEDRLYTWWDYRAGNFHKHKGMRIDHLLATPVLADRLRWSIIDRNARKGTGPSDHAPLLAEFEPDAC